MEVGPSRAQKPQALRAKAPAENERPPTSPPMNHRERTAQLTAEGSAALDLMAEREGSYRALALTLIKQMAWARDKMERGEKLCKDPYDRAHLRTVKQALVLEHPLLKKEKHLIMDLLQHVPSETTARKSLPICTGVLDYFPDALLAVAEVSRVGNDQHNPGQPLHWDKSKSTDEADALLRHLMDRGGKDADGVRHSAKVAWRALALLQREIDAERGDVSDAPRTTVETPKKALLSALQETLKSVQLYNTALHGAHVAKPGEAPTPPEGFALIAEGKVQIGDRIFSVLLPESVQKPWEEISATANLIGADIKQGLEHGFYVARKAEVVTPVEVDRTGKPEPIKIPKDRAGWRMLEKGEIIQAGDAIQIGNEKFETAKGLIGYDVDGPNEAFRRISDFTTPATPERKKPRRWRWQPLESDMLIQKGDRVFSPSKKKFEPASALIGLRSGDVAHWKAERRVLS